MIAAATERSPPRRISTKQFKKTPARRASKEALMRGFIMYITIFMVQGKSCRFMHVSPEQNFFRILF
jgi:hypothetical protein